jgi:APA family basic amino acid/polyamine antiporter
MQEFQKNLTWFDSICLVTGVIVGSGIFLTTGIIAKQIHSPLWILLVWLVGGILAFCEAITFAQLAMLYPKAGGNYVYLKEAFGGYLAFSYGVSLFVIMQCGSIASIATGFAHYFGHFVPCCSMEKIWVLVYFWGFSKPIVAGQIIALALLWILTGFHCFGGKLGTGVQNFLTCLKILALLAFIACFFSLSNPDFSVDFIGKRPSIFQWGIALMMVMWAYAGSHNLGYAAEEICIPKKSIPLALLTSIAIVTALYLAINTVYLLAMPLSKIQGTVTIAHAVAKHLFGDAGVHFISLCILLATAGATSVIIFSSPRVYFAMARDKVFPGLKANLHPKYQTPTSFLLAQAIWTSILILVGNYESLFVFVMFPGFIFFAFIGIALLILRFRHLDLPIKMGYPYITIIYILSYLFLAGNTFVQYPKESLLGVFFLLLSYPLYHWMKSNP